MEQRSGVDVLDTTCAALNALRSLVDLDLASLPDEDLDLVLQTHEELVRTSAYIQQKYAGEVDERGLAVRRGHVRHGSLLAGGAADHDGGGEGAAGRA